MPNDDGGLLGQISDMYDEDNWRQTRRSWGMGDTTRGFFDEIDAHRAAKEAKEAKELADMFYQPSICRHCGAQVVFLEQHKAFHDGIEKWMQGVIGALEKAGFESREQRAERIRARREAMKGGGRG